MEIGRAEALTLDASQRTALAIPPTALPTEDATLPTEEATPETAEEATPETVDEAEAAALATEPPTLAAPATPALTPCPTDTLAPAVASSIASLSINGPASASVISVCSRLDSVCRSRASEGTAAATAFAVPEAAGGVTACASATTAGLKALLAPPLKSDVNLPGSATG